MVSGVRQILENIELHGQLHCPPRFAHLGEQHKMAFLRGKGDADFQVKAQASTLG